MSEHTSFEEQVEQTHAANVLDPNLSLIHI